MDQYEQQRAPYPHQQTRDLPEYLASAILLGIFATMGFCTVTYPVLVFLLWWR